MLPGDAVHLGVLGGGVVAVGAERQARGGHRATQLRQPGPEFGEQPGLGLPGHRFPGAERAVAGGRGAAARPVGDQGAPEVDAVLDVLHVDVHLDRAPGHLDPGDATAPVDGGIPESGPGPINLLGQAPHRLVAVGRRAQAQGPRVAQRADARRPQARELRPLPAPDDGRDRRVIGPGAQRRRDRPQVHAASDQGGGAVVERGERRPAGNAVAAVDTPFPPAHARQQARVAGSGPEPRAAPGPPGAFRALADPHRYHEQRYRRIGLMPGGDREDVEAEGELEVVHLHGGAPLRPARRGRGRPTAGIQVVPGDDAVDADDAAQALPGRSHPARFEHALVVGELEEILLVRTGRGARPKFRCLRCRIAERRTAGRPAAGAGVEAAVVLDVRGPVPRAARRGHQQVGFAHPPVSEIRRKAPAQDERPPRLHRIERGVLAACLHPTEPGVFAPGPVLAGNDVSRRVKREKAGDDFCLELLAPRKPARKHRRRRQGLTRPDGVPLGADRALLGHITALRWHARRIVASAHRPMILNASDRTENPGADERSQLSRHPADHSSGDKWASR